MLVTFVFSFIGILAGAICVWLLVDAKRRRLAGMERQLQIRASQNEVAAREHEQQLQSWASQQEHHFATQAAQIQERLKGLEHQQRVLEGQAQERLKGLELQQRLLDSQALKLKESEKEFAAKAVTYNELSRENEILRREVFLLHVESSKRRLDRDKQKERQEQLDTRAHELATRYLKETEKWIASSLNQNNYFASKQRLIDVIGRCRDIGFPISADEESARLASLKEEYQLVVRAALEREEQARIKAQMREEQLRQKEIERELQQLEREREAIKAALEKALAEAQDQHSEEVERLQARLAEAEAKSQRAISQAQLTKAGHVYVISNIGSFGDGVFKVGMTRRLEPLDRVRELSSASVPFPFDVHMVISCNDAPGLENALHRALFRNRINKANPRKEFFKTDIATIVEVVKKNHGEVQYVADVEALEYRQTLSMTEDDHEFIEAAYRFEDEEEMVPDDA